MKEIYIKGFWGSWEKVTKEKAQSYVFNLYHRITVGDHDHKVKCIEENHLKGITFDELMEGVSL